MLDLEGTYRLSQYVFMRPTRSYLILESALSNLQVKITNKGILNLLFAFTHPCRPKDLLDGLGVKERMTLGAFLKLCDDHGLLTPTEENGIAQEESNYLAHWEFHDLLFHSRSRFGKTIDSVGATFRFADTVSPEPPRKIAEQFVRRIPLPRPCMESLKKADPSLSAILEERRSIRKFAPLSLAELGEFLYRTCRITGEEPAPLDLKVFLKKVYPSGGSLHSLEFYIAASACHGLEPGLYYYDAGSHELGLIRNIDSDVNELFEKSKISLGDLSPEPPPVLIVMTARFRRNAWKYQSIAYRAILMEVGGVYQTMYLVATAMKLAPCAIGCGDSVHFAKLIGMNYYLESSVGEFILGGRNEAIKSVPETEQDGP